MSISTTQTLTLTSRDWEAFFSALDDADRLRPQLAAAARRYQSRRPAPNASSDAD
jgi:uncharacterized protein (DUF1778 family)